MPTVSMTTFVKVARQRKLYDFNRSIVQEGLGNIDHFFVDALVLDAGAGRRRKHFDPQIREAKYIVGIDIDEGDLQVNGDVDAKVVGDLQTLPFTSNTFDCIVSVDVVEHLEHPADFFREASRILKPGGVLVVCTPNLLGYKNLITRMLPRSVLDLAWKVLKGQSGQPHRTYYRSNSDWRIRRIASSTRLKVELIKHLNEITHFAYPYPVLATLVYAHGRLLERLNLGRLLPYLVCILRKGEGDDEQSLNSRARVYV